MFRQNLSLLAVVLCTLSARAEQSKFNLHLEPGVGLGLNDSANYLSGVALQVDTTVFNLGIFAPEIEIYALGSVHRSYLADGQAFGAGIGARLRLLNDEKGYRFVPGGVSGNWWGNLWLDAHVNYSHGGLGVGFDVGAGYEFSVLDGLQLGPFAKFYMPGPNQLLLFGLTFSIGVPSNIPDDADPDKDGIMGSKDKCPNDPEDKDNFEDADGCPEKDNDKDGIEDPKDQCPVDPEDKDNFEDADGCPEKDNDKDGLEDPKDQCPVDPEDKDNFEDADGCPDKDNDKDGLEDVTDKCPDEAEDKDGFEDDDGCPEKDNDKDGYEDAKDKCPNEAETFNGIEDEDGCPEKEAKVFVTKEKIVITEKVFFAFNKSNILPKSDALLNNVAEVLKKFPDVKKIRIDGHTDDVGGDGKNQTLSEKRAQAVLAALVKRGIDKGRLAAKGFGKTVPLVKGVDEAAREQNRRVEFTILDGTAAP
jgi:outer membrane protein OmpA-like peptidoglycan-associated protein